MGGLITRYIPYYGNTSGQINSTKNVTNDIKSNSDHNISNSAQVAMESSFVIIERNQDKINTLNEHSDTSKENDISSNQNPENRQNTNSIVSSAFYPNNPVDRMLARIAHEDKDKPKLDKRDQKKTCSQRNQKAYHSQKNYYGFQVNKKLQQP